MYVTSLFTIMVLQKLYIVAGLSIRFRVKSIATLEKKQVKNILS